jgi:hypothetical protein
MPFIRSIGRWTMTALVINSIIALRNRTEREVAGVATEPSPAVMPTVDVS